jgi:hypothetical protein
MRLVYLLRFTLFHRIGCKKLSDKSSLAQYLTNQLSRPYINSHTFLERFKAMPN